MRVGRDNSSISGITLYIGQCSKTAAGRRWVGVWYLFVPYSDVLSAFSARGFIDIAQMKGIRWRSAVVTEQRDHVL